MQWIKLIFVLILYVELFINVESGLDNWKVWKKRNKKTTTPPQPPPNSLAVVPYQGPAGQTQENAQHEGGSSSFHGHEEESFHGSLPGSPLSQRSGSFSQNPPFSPLSEKSGSFSSPPLSPQSQHEGSSFESMTSSPFSQRSGLAHRSGPSQPYERSTSQLSDYGGSTRGHQPQGFQPNGYPPQGYPPQGYPPHGYPPQGYPPQGYPPQGYPPNGYQQQVHHPNAYQQQLHPQQQYQQNAYAPNGNQQHEHPPQNEISPLLISGEEPNMPAQGIFIHEGTTHQHLFPLPAQRKLGQWSFGKHFPNEQPLGLPGSINKERPDDRLERHLQFEGIFSFDYHVTDPHGREITRVEFVSALGRDSHHEKIQQIGKSRAGNSIYFRFWSERGLHAIFTLQCYTVHSHQQSHAMPHGPVPVMPHGPVPVMQHGPAPVMH